MSALSRKTLQRITEIEDRLASGVSEGRVKHDLAQQCGISPRQARRLLRIVHLRWQAEAEAADRPRRRAILRAAGWDTFRTARSRQAMALDKSGGEHYYANPDAGAMVRALEFLARLDGDLTQPEAGGDLNVNLFQVLQQHYGMTPEAVEAAVHARSPHAIEAGAEPEE